MGGDIGTYFDNIWYDEEVGCKNQKYGRYKK
jgi:hypothetical protein